MVEELFIFVIILKFIPIFPKRKAEMEGKSIRITIQSGPRNQGGHMVAEWDRDWKH